jgi:hypothetical protein
MCVGEGKRGWACLARRGRSTRHPAPSPAQPATGAVATYGNDAAALDALADGVAVADRSHCGRVRVAGAGARAFLHGQATAPLAAAAPGAVIDAVLCTPTGRCVDAVTAVVLEGAVLLLTSPAPASAAALARLDKVCFPADGVTLTNVAPSTSCIALAGPGAAALLTALGAGDAALLAPGAHALLAGGPGRAPIVVARHPAPGLLGGVPSFSLVADATAGADLWRAALKAGAVPAGDAAWDRARVAAGVPAAGSELDGDHNPFEAGLAHRVSLAKGCYAGQEALAKLAGAGRVKQELWRLDLEGEVAVGAEVRAAGADPSSGGPPAGRVTSVAADKDGAPIALAYVSTSRAGGELREGLAVEAGGVRARLAHTRAATRALPAVGGAPPAAPAPAEDGGGRAARLAAMQSRLEAWRAEQEGEGQEG